MDDQTLNQYFLHACYYWATQNGDPNPITPLKNNCSSTDQEFCQCAQVNDNYQITEWNSSAPQPTRDDLKAYTLAQLFS